jgi:hypothetical protein
LCGTSGKAKGDCVLILPIPFHGTMTGQLTPTFHHPERRIERTSVHPFTMQQLCTGISLIFGIFGLLTLGETFFNLSMTFRLLFIASSIIPRV